MNPLGFPILSWIIFLPLIGAALILFVRQTTAIRVIALLTSLAVFGLFLLLYANFNATTGELQFIEDKAWVDQFGIRYHLGTDGISLLLVGLTVFLMPLAILGSWTGITERVKEFHLFMLLLETGMLGVFVAFDLFLFYLFWEAMLIPMYFLIGIWGHDRKVYAAVKFFLFTMFGSLLMLVAILALYYLHYAQTGVFTFDLLTLYQTSIPSNLQIWLAAAFLLAFAIKVPVFPLHTWLPDAHVEAPTAGSVILAGVLLKMGTYGFIRFSLPLFPETLPVVTPWLCLLALIGIIYGAMVSFVQPDLKKLVAYSSVSHLGFCVLGIFVLNQQGLEGAILQMLSHGFSTGALFFVVGMLYERRHTRLIEEFGGLWKVIPVFAAFFMVFTLASLGLPGLSNFVGEFLILVGVFRVNKLYAAVAAAGVILAAIYMLWMYRRVMFGQITKPANEHLRDLSLREGFILACLTIMIIWVGVYPKPFITTMDASVQKLLGQVNGVASVSGVKR